MKLYLNNKQRNYLLEIFKTSEQNAINGKDQELATAFSELYEKIKPLNVACVVLKRHEAEAVVEFCDIISNSLRNAINFLNKDTTRSKEEISNLLDQAQEAKLQIESISEQLSEKIKNNPIEEKA